jgi:uncharacterized protein YraI
MTKKLRIFLIVAVFICFLPLTAAAKMVSVVGDNVNLRSGPGTNYSVKWKFGSGFPLEGSGQERTAGTRLKTFEGDTGWLYEKLTSPNGHMVVKVHKNQNEKINIRSGPGTNYKIVGKAYYGVVFRTIEATKWLGTRQA